MNRQTNKVNDTNEFNESKYFFRGLLLDGSSITDSQLEGLKRRYPQAWLNRKSYPFFEHNYIKTIDLNREFSKNIKQVFILGDYVKTDVNGFLLNIVFVRHAIMKNECLIKF